MTETPVAPSRILLIPLGFTIWSVAFVVLYATNAVGCAFGWDEGIQRGALIAISIAFLGLCGGAFRLVHRHWAHKAKGEVAPAPTVAKVATYGLGSAFVALFGISVPALTASLCI